MQSESFRQIHMVNMYGVKTIHLFAFFAIKVSVNIIIETSLFGVTYFVSYNAIAIFECV